MPVPNDASWALVYRNPRSSQRVLLSLPPDMLLDAKEVARFLTLEEGVDVSVAELMRRALTVYMTQYSHLIPLQGSAHDVAETNRRTQGARRV